MNTNTAHPTPLGGTAYAVRRPDTTPYAPQVGDRVRTHAWRYTTPTPRRAPAYGTVLELRPEADGAFVRLDRGYTTFRRTSDLALHGRSTTPR